MSKPGTFRDAMTGDLERRVESLERTRRAWRIQQWVLLVVLLALVFYLALT